MKQDIVYYIIVEKTKDIKPIDIIDLMLKKFNLSTTNIVKNEYGKPYFTNNIYFNYSHSKHYIACAISLSEVGIDIDEPRIINDEISKRYLDNVDESNRLKVWVQKEAYSKLKGIGFSIDFSTIDLTQITNANKLIENNKYTCSIYSDKDNIDFIEMEI